MTNQGVYFQLSHLVKIQCHHQSVISNIKKLLKSFDVTFKKPKQVKSSDKFVDVCRKTKVRHFNSKFSDETFFMLKGVKFPFHRITSDCGIKALKQH